MLAAGLSALVIVVAYRCFFSMFVAQTDNKGSHGTR